MKVKDFGIKIKSLDLKSRIVEGYFASFDTIDSDNDVFRKGAFAKSIAENGPKSTKQRIKHLFNHWDTVGVLQELEEDNFGLRYVSKIGTHSLGNDVIRMYADGIITEHSVGFNEIKSDLEPQSDGRNIRIIKEVRLWEGSSLDKWGANMNTPVLKSIDEVNAWIKQWHDRIELITKSLSGRTEYTDETYQLLNIQLMQLKDMLTVALNVVKPQSTQPNEPQNIDIDYIKLLKLFKNEN